MKPERIQVTEVATTAAGNFQEVQPNGSPGLSESVDPVVRLSLPCELPDVSVESLRLVTRYRLAVVSDGEVAVPETRFDRPSVAAKFFWAELKDRPQEVMVAAFVDIRHLVIGWQHPYQGTLNRCTAEPRAILQAALLVNAAGIVLCHNHPTGDPKPSTEDIAFTQRMCEAAEIVGVRVMDHVIVGEGGQWVSLKQRLGL